MDANVMDTEKKVYNTPELREYGTLSETTRGEGDDVPMDAFPTAPFFFSGGNV